MIYLVIRTSDKYQSRTLRQEDADWARVHRANRKNTPNLSACLWCVERRMRKYEIERAEKIRKNVSLETRYFSAWDETHERIQISVADRERKTERNDTPRETFTIYRRLQHSSDNKPSKIRSHSVLIYADKLDITRPGHWSSADTRYRVVETGRSGVEQVSLGELRLV